MSMYQSSQGIQSHIRVHWPGYLWRFVGLIFSLLLIAYALEAGWASLAAIGTGLLITFAFLLLAALWAAQLKDSAGDPSTTEFLYQMSQTRPFNNLACIDLGLREQSIALSQHLTSGQLFVIDIYNPQLMPDKSLVRARQLAPPSFADPRIVRYDGSLDLLPLPDNSVQAVFLQDVLSKFVQRGDQQVLLREVNRILEPNGRLLLAEPIDSWPNRILPGSTIRFLNPKTYWSNLLLEAGFDLRREQTLHRLTYCIRADVPPPYAGKQLTLDLEFEAF